ncbi:hypothetical protein IVG45_16730 [Methylomonas sp. LL1]|uniref:hypothetical protein n=1 Tax=Methylomonas sp. LL1 TaxID=2785785 RepID=UPI0018C374E7|nr:hypothetical protein [Methylomonas sp. LL1]QPK62483.1 hypothetical protein IVG45_16730 [Methylomonas sp. LL1]
MDLRKLYWLSLQHTAELIKKNRPLYNRFNSIYCFFQQKRNHGIYAININSTNGFFAQLNWCIYIFDYCDHLGLRPFIHLSSPFYTVKAGDNWLDYFFTQNQATKIDKDILDNKAIIFSEISEINQLWNASKISEKMSLNHANYLLNKYLTISNDIQQYVNLFVQENFSLNGTLGIHFRGTDKTSEASRVKWEYVKQCISNYLEKHNQVDTIFVASDEIAFIEWIKAEFNYRLRVVSHNDQEISRDGKPIHANPNKGCNYTKGKEALINCLLLSKCDALVRTASFLSGWASIFNPTMPVIMLNKPYTQTTWFPDKVILQNSLSSYLPHETSKSS